MENVQLARPQLKRDDSGHFAVVHDQIDAVKFVKKGDVILDTLLIKRLQNHMAGAVGGVAGAPYRLLAKITGVAAKAPLADSAFRRAVEGQAHMFQLNHGVDGVFGQNVRRVLIDQIIAAFDRIVGVPERFIFVQIAECRADAALSRAGMASGRVELADYCDLRSAF